MPAWSFQPRFAFALANGLALCAHARPPFPGHRPKRQTIRKARRDGRDPIAGDRMNLWIAQRTPERRFLGTTPPIRRREIRIAHRDAVVVNGARLGMSAMAQLAVADGFPWRRELFEFIETTHGFPFVGFVYRW